VSMLRVVIAGGLALAGLILVLNGRFWGLGLGLILGGIALFLTAVV
jgi:hypothetical protein